MMRHGINKCRVCDHYINWEDTCEFCDFKWATEYSPWSDDWDIFNIDDDVEWSFLQIQDRLKYHDIDCLLVINWCCDDNAIVLIGCMSYADRIAKALGINEECIVQDLQYGITIINLFKEKWLRGLVGGQNE